jgi:sulfite exporter TauE/SafE
MSAYAACITGAVVGAYGAVLSIHLHFDQATAICASVFVICVVVAQSLDMSQPL